MDTAGFQNVTAAVNNFDESLSMRPDYVQRGRQIQ